MSKTRFCEWFGINAPLVVAPMALISRGQNSLPLSATPADWPSVVETRIDSWREGVMRSEHAYQILLRAYPRRYRQEYVQAMAQCFRDQLREANTLDQLLWLWARTIADFAVTVIGRHWECVAGRDERRVPPRARYQGTPSGYTDGAMRSIYLARLEAGSFGSSEISLEHLPLGTLRHDHELGAAILGNNGRSHRPGDRGESH
jgi:hypothetical protein